MRDTTEKILFAILVPLMAGGAGLLTMAVLTGIWASESVAQLNANEIGALHIVFLPWLCITCFAYGCWLGYDR